MESSTHELEKIWHGVLAELQLQLTKTVYGTCFAKSELVSLENNVATIGCVNPVISKLIDERYYSLVKSVIDNRTKQNVSLVFTTKKYSSPQSNNLGPLFSEERFSSATPQQRKIGLGSEYTFETFAVSSTNQMAYAAAIAVSQDPGKTYNPLLLYGGVGVGKTHLMQAIGHAVLSKNQDAKVVFATGEEFTNEIIEGIKHKSTAPVKNKYRSANLLLVDDIQFIAGKQSIQEEFFHTFNAIRRDGGQIVLTSDRPPSEMAKLEERLRSRFEAGLTIDIGEPNFELRAAITEIKSEMLGVVIPSDIAQLIAANITSARAIEGFLRRIKTELATRKEPLTPELVSSLLGKPKEEKLNGKKVSAQDIIESVAQFYDLKPGVLKGVRRNRPIARPRQVVMHLCKTQLGQAYTDIGLFLGGRDHTTIMHGVETITRELSTNEKLRGDVERIKQQLWGLF